MSTILSILGAIGSAFLAVLNFFRDRAVRQAEDSKIEVATLKGELHDVQIADQARDAVRNNPPDRVRDDDGFRRD